MSACKVLHLGPHNILTVKNESMLASRLQPSRALDSPLGAWLSSIAMDMRTANGRAYDHTWGLGLHARLCRVVKILAARLGTEQDKHA